MSLQGRILSMMSTQTSETSTNETGNSAKWSSLIPLSTCTYSITDNSKNKCEFNGGKNWSATLKSWGMKQEETKSKLFIMAFGWTKKEELLHPKFYEAIRFYYPIIVDIKMLLNALNRRLRNIRCRNMSDKYLWPDALIYVLACLGIK